MLELNTKTVIFIGGPKNFDFCESIEIVSTWDQLTDTAVIRMPAKVSYKNAFGEESRRITGTGNEPINDNYPVFLPGQDVTLSAGYGSDVPVLFTGFVSGVTPNLPIEINAQDPSWFLKQSLIPNTSHVNIKLSDLMDEILQYSLIPFEQEGFGGGYGLKIHADIVLGEIRIPEKTIAEVLAHIKKEYGLVSWFQDFTLNIGVAYVFTDPADVFLISFKLGENVIDGKNLMWISEAEQKISLKVVSIYPDNTQEEVTRGVEGGEQRTMFVYDQPKDSLDLIADENYHKFQDSGYTGYFETFLQPTVRHGDGIKLADPEFPERDGIYLVKKVITRYGINGGRQLIYLDIRIKEGF